MKLLAIAGLATLALIMPAQAADECANWDTQCKAKQGQQQPTGQIPPECTGYGGKPPHCAQWEQQGGGWQGQGTPGQPGAGTWNEPKPGTPTPPPGHTPTTTTKRECQPGYTLVLRGRYWRCVRQGGQQDQTTGRSCQYGWTWSKYLYKCVPGFVGGSDEERRRICGYGKVWNDYFQKCIPYRVGGGEGTPGGQGCRRGEVWSHSQYRCVRLRTGGGTDGGYNCGPGERWSNSQYRCVPRRGGDGPAIGLGGSGINIYIGGGKKKRHGDGEYGRDGRDGRDGGGDYGYRGSGGNDYRGRGR